MVTLKKYPVPIVRGEVAHTTKQQCPSPSTESCDILVLQSGDKLVFDDPQTKTLKLRLINDCIGNKDEINRWIQKMKNGEFKNIDPNTIQPLPKFEDHVKLSSSEFWYRFYCTYIYKDKLDGSYSILKDVDLRYISSLIINDGQEYFYLTGDPNNIVSYNWENIKEKLDDEKLYRQTKFSRCHDNFNEVGNVRVLQIASGVFNAATEFVPHFVRDSLITRTAESIRRRIKSKHISDNLSIAEIILPFTQTQEDLFIVLYDEGFFGSRIVGKRKAAIGEILKNIQKRYNNYPSLRSIKSPTALKYHIEFIEKILSKLHEQYVDRMTNIEAELVYQILVHLRREYDNDKISFERKIRFNEDV